MTSENVVIISRAPTLAVNCAPTGPSSQSSRSAFPRAAAQWTSVRAAASLWRQKLRQFSSSHASACAGADFEMALADWQQCCVERQRPVHERRALSNAEAIRCRRFPCRPRSRSRLILGCSTSSLSASRRVALSSRESPRACWKRGARRADEKR